MRGALIDLSNRIRHAAESIPSEAMAKTLSVAV